MNSYSSSYWWIYSTGILIEFQSFFIYLCSVLNLCAFMIIWCSLHFCDCKGTDAIIWVSPDLFLCMCMCMCVLWNILWNKLMHYFVFLFCFWWLACVTFSVHFLFHLGFGFKWWEGPVWFLWSTNSSYQWWCPSRNNTPTSAWVRFDYKSYWYIFFDHRETMPSCRIYVI